MVRAAQPTGDVGRTRRPGARAAVWLGGEDSDEWRPSYGGGLAFEVAGSPVVFWSGVAKAHEQAMGKGNAYRSLCPADGGSTVFGSVWTPSGNHRV